MNSQLSKINDFPQVSSVNDLPEPAMAFLKDAIVTYIGKRVVLEGLVYYDKQWRFKDGYRIYTTAVQEVIDRYFFRTRNTTYLVQFRDPNNYYLDTFKQLAVEHG